jgi:hypothetical protein
VTALPYARRRHLLEGLALAGSAWATKRTDSPYRPGVRSGDWLKLKTADRRAVLAPRRIDARR